MFPQLDKTQRAEVGGIAVTLGLLSMTVDGIPQRRPKSRNEAGTRMVCPDPHVDGHGKPTAELFTVSEVFVCAQDHRHTRGELARARETVLSEGTDNERTVLVPITVDERTAAVTGDMREKELELIPVPADQVARYTRPEGTGYRLRLPKKHPAKAAELYAVLLELAADGDVALVGPMCVGSTRRFWQLTAWNGQLFLEARIETADLAPPDEQDLPAVDPAAVAMARTLVESLALDEFDPSMFRHDAKAAIDAVATARAESGDVALTPAAAAPAATTGSLLDALTDMVAAQRAAKAKRATKKAPAKKAAAVRKAG